jgi:hypothetical protein
MRIEQVRAAAMPLVMGLVAAVGGCASRIQTLVSDPVGPARPHVARRRQEGRLVVYSAPEVVTAEQSEYPVHTPYALSDASGKFLRDVENRAGIFASEPVSLPLPVGQYRIKALEEGARYVVVPVVIEADKTTVVDLDGTALPQGAPEDNDLVKLPGGHVVGWRAD